MRIPRTLALVLAGGKGSRLGALTEKKVKPALPVAGTYRLIDVALSNLVHSHLSDVWVVEQFLPHSLNQHLANGRPWDLDRTHGGLQVLPPYQDTEGEGFAEGNADSLYRQKDLIRDFAPDLVLVLSADHLYTLNFLDVIDTHLERGADLTVVTTLVDEDPSRYGVVQADDGGRVTGFDYKPDEPRGRLVAAEMFLYDAEKLLEALDLVHEQEGGLEDYGNDLVPWFVAHRTVVEHRLDGYWMDLGTLQSYWTTCRCSTATAWPWTTPAGRSSRPSRSGCPPGSPAAPSCAGRWSPRARWCAAPWSTRCSAPASSSRRAPRCAARCCWTASGWETG